MPSNSSSSWQASGASRQTAVKRCQPRRTSKPPELVQKKKQDVRTAWKTMEKETTTWFMILKATTFDKSAALLLHDNSWCVKSWVHVPWYLLDAKPARPTLTLRHMYFLFLQPSFVHELDETKHTKTKVANHLWYLSWKSHWKYFALYFAECWISSRSQHLVMLPMYIDHGSLHTLAKELFIAIMMTGHGTFGSVVNTHNGHWLPAPNMVIHQPKWEDAECQRYHQRSCLCIVKQ